MADFTSSGLYGLPALTQLGLEGKDARLLDSLSGWITEAIQEGDLINESDPNYEHMAGGMAYVSGDQLPPPDNAKEPQYLQQVMIDMCTKAMRTHVSALTDLKPVGGWKSENNKYQFHADLLNRLTITWWVTQMADVQLGEAVKYAWAAGTGDVELTWDPTLPGGGNHVLIAHDARDTLPIRPGRARGTQGWKGLIRREVWTVAALRDKYPLYAPYITEAQVGVLSTIRGWFFSSKPRMQSPADPLAYLGQPRKAGPPRPGEAVLYRVFLDDRSRNSTSRPIVMGDPGTSWGYVVAPGELLYPNKRLICRINDHLIVYDGPSPFWHGQYPVERLMLWSLPWYFLGISALRTLKPLQNAINESIQQHRLGVRRWMEQGMVINTSAMGNAASAIFDIRKPAQKVKVKGTAIRLEDMVRPIDGPNPQAMALNFQMYQELIQRFEYLSGVANLQELMQLRQLPGADTIEKYYEALTPEIRDEGRNIEAFIRSISKQILYNTFQFMDSTRRVHLLGTAGLALEDFDFDPDLLVPSQPKVIPAPNPVDPTGQMGLPPIEVPNPDYDPLFDAAKSRAERAKAMARLMTFVVNPNSLLAMNAQEEKMTDFQLARMGYMDFWSLMERLERPNVGTPPPIPLPPLRKPTIEEFIQGLQVGRFIINPAAMAGMMGGMLPGGGPDPNAPPPPGEEGGQPGSPPPGQPPGGGILGGVITSPMDAMQKFEMLLETPGAILEVRMPVTITERLQAQQILGIGMTENPAGRKASGGSEPKMEKKSDGQGGERQTITESSGSRNA
jgi:hypothetical protein